MDPLSDVLSLLRPQSYMFRGFDAGGQWSMHYPPQQGIRCFAMIEGECWLAVEGIPNPVSLIAGDCVLLPGGEPLRLASDLTIPAVDAMTVFPSAQEGGVVTYNGGGGCFGLGGYFEFPGKHAGLLLGVLPSIIHIHKASDKAALRSLIEQIMTELRDPQPGGFLVAQHLAHLMLVQALRRFLAENSNDGVGWLYALMDKQMSAVIGAMHDAPSRAWTLQTLAELAAMSRSAFALKFKATVGLSPMDYLTRWRMLLAANRLTNTNESIAIIAPSLGYESESAFSAAFKRVMGCSPRAYCLEQKAD